ncbi:methyltransferase [Amycolatopsis sp. H6(2020)]|nr:methyltransferase [Amycolatopsis sp. H6(2020)]
MTEHERMSDLLFGSLKTQLVGCAARLGLADALADDQLDAWTVADRLGTDPDVTARLLRALCALELVTEAGPGQYRLTGTGSLLRTDRPDSVNSVVLAFADPEMDAWKHPDQAVRSGRPADLHGTTLFEFLGSRPELSERFNAAMRQITLPIALALPKAYDFSRFATIADVGGGDGTVLVELLRANPRLHGLLCDSAKGLSEAPGTLAAAGVEDRCALRPGNVADTVPKGCDAYLLRSVLHNWDDQRCATILGNCRAAIATDGRLLLVETVLPAVVAPSDAVLYLNDLTMLVNTGGRERTAAEIEKLCAGSGFTIVDLHPLPAPLPYSIVEAVPD